MPTVDAKIAASHEAGGLADQEHCGAAVLLWDAQLPKHVLRRPVATSFRVLLEESFDHGGDDVAGRDSVDTNTVLAPFGSEVAC